MKRTLSTNKTRKAQIMKGGEGILTYTNNNYITNLPLDAYATRQMYNDQTTMNARTLLNGGGKKKNQKKKKATQKKTSKKVAKNRTKRRWFAFWWKWIFIAMDIEIKNTLS